MVDAGKVDHDIDAFVSLGDEAGSPLHILQICDIGVERIRPAVPTQLGEVAGKFPAFSLKRRPFPRLVGLRIDDHHSSSIIPVVVILYPAASPASSRRNPHLCLGVGSPPDFGTRPRLESYPVVL